MRGLPVDSEKGLHLNKVVYEELPRLGFGLAIMTHNLAASSDCNLFCYPIFMPQMVLAACLSSMRHAMFSCSYNFDFHLFLGLWAWNSD